MLGFASPKACAGTKRAWLSHGQYVGWWLCSGEDVIPFSFAGLQSGRCTWGLRFSEEPSMEIGRPADYFDYLNAQGIILDPEQRKALIWEQAQKLAKSIGGDLAEDPDLLAEVTNLVERPTAMLGSFEQRYIQNLPPEVLIGVMRKHQRYFPVSDAQGHLQPYFIFVRNGDERYQDVVTDGNLQVIHARFADAEFFIQEDRQKKLEEFIPKLSQLTFQKIWVQCSRRRNASNS